MVIGILCVCCYFERGFKYNDDWKVYDTSRDTELKKKKNYLCLLLVQYFLLYNLQSTGRLSLLLVEMSESQSE